MISPDLTTNDPKKQQQSESGGLTMDATGAENHTTILVIEPSPVEKNMLWVGTDDGQVHYTQNGGTTWTRVNDNILICHPIAGLLKLRHPTNIKVRHSSLLMTTEGLTTRPTLTEPKIMESPGHA